MGCSINSPALSLLMKHLVIGQRLKTPNFSAFHWSPRGSLVSIGQHFVATRVVHLPKSTESSLFTESDQRGPNHQLLQLCTAHTAWSDSDQAVRAVHSCNSWLMSISCQRCISFKKGPVVYLRIQILRFVAVTNMCHYEYGYFCTNYDMMVLLPEGTK